LNRVVKVKTLSDWLSDDSNNDPPSGNLPDNPAADAVENVERSEAQLGPDSTTAVNLDSGAGEIEGVEHETKD
jgi:hypothetical protein